MGYQLELAQKRLQEFQVKHNASIEEVAKALGLRSDMLEEMATREDSHTYADTIVRELGSEMLETTERKLAELRGKKPASSKTASAPEKKPRADKKLNHKAAEMLREFRGEDSWNAVADKLNPHSKRAYKGKVLASRFSNSGVDLVSDRFAQGVIDAIEAYKAALRGHEAIKKTGPKIEEESAEAKAGDVTQTQHNVTQEPAADSDETEIDDTSHEGLDAEEPARAEEPEHPQESHIHFAIALNKMAVQAAARDMIEEAFGISLEELKELRPHIEIMAVAKRNKVPACLMVDPVDV